MNFQNAVLSERRQTQKTTFCVIRLHGMCCVIQFIWNVQLRQGRGQSTSRCRYREGLVSTQAKVAGPSSGICSSVPCLRRWWFRGSQHQGLLCLDCGSIRTSLPRMRKLSLGKNHPLSESLVLSQLWVQSTPHSFPEPFRDCFHYRLVLAFMEFHINDDIRYTVFQVKLLSLTMFLWPIRAAAC